MNRAAVAVNGEVSVSADWGDVRIVIKSGPLDNLSDARLVAAMLRGMASLLDGGADAS